MDDRTILWLAGEVAVTIASTPRLDPLNAWSAELHRRFGDDAYVAEVDRTWPLVRDILEAARFTRRAS